MDSECESALYDASHVTTAKSDAQSCGFELDCGCFKTNRRPVKILDIFCNAKAALLFLSCGLFLQGLEVSGLFGIVVSTVEKRFDLRSAETGFIAGCYDIGVIIALPFVTYIGGRGHKPLWLGWGVMLMGVGFIVFSLPHFIAPDYDPSGVENFQCDQRTEKDCGRSGLREYRWFFIASQLLVGLGACPLFTLAITYLDASVKQSSSSLYHGVLFSLFALGPGVGYILGGYCLTFFTNFFQSVDIDPASTAWIGNWWIVFLLAGCIALLISIALLMFPKELPNSEKYSMDREKEVHGPKALSRKLGSEKETLKTIAVDAPNVFLSLFKNPVLVLISISGAMDLGVLAGIAAFGPKYVEAAFNVSSSHASVCFGILAIVGVGVGNLLGGYVVARFRMSVPQILNLCIASSACSLAGIFIFLMTCKNPDTTWTQGIDCDSQCGCTTEFFSPVCGADNKTYLSYCHAGCVKDGQNAADIRFINCTRIRNDNASSDRTFESVPGKCPSDACSSVLLFMAGAAVCLRTVPFHQRSVAVGIKSLFMRVLGIIPIPVIIGRALDSACLVWGEECGECGSCKLYDNMAVSRYVTLTCATAKAITLIGYIAAAKLYKPPSSSLPPGEDVGGKDDQ